MTKVLQGTQVEFRVNGIKQDYSMKLGEGGEAFFVFETTDDIPESLQTSPVVSPAPSPKTRPEEGPDAASLQEPEFLDLSGGKINTLNNDVGATTSLPASPQRVTTDLGKSFWSMFRVVLN